MNLKSFQHLTLFTVPLAVGLGISLGGLWTFLTPFYLFVLIPLSDHFSGLDEINPTKEENSFLYDLWLKIWVPIQVVVMGWALFHLTTASLTTYEQVGLVISVGMMAGGGGITVAHELMHRKNAFERALAEILMTSVFYTHFCVEHVLGHHKFVGTPRDSATSRLNEGLYAYLPRTFWGGYKSAWQLETDRVRNRDISLTLKDRRLRYALYYLVMFSLLYWGFGLAGCFLFLAQSFVAILLVEIINYVEHYGLSRKQLENGRYERVAPKHSWNSAHRVTNAILINLPRHADHHYMASRPYKLLRHIDDSPQLPTGYAAMLLLALFPPLWKKVMNPLVKEWNARSLVQR